MLFSKIKIFFKFLKKEWKVYTEYKLQFVVGLFWTAIGTTVFYFIWQYIISKGSFNLYSISEITIYMFFVINFAYNFNWGQNIRREIINGEVVIPLTKNLNLWEYFSLNYISGILTHHTIAIILGLFIGIYFIGIYSVLGIIFWLLGIIIGAFIFTIVAYSSFWFGDNWGIFFSISEILSIINGSILPLNVFPVWAQKIILVLPFKFMFYVPAKIFIGQMKVSWFLLLEYVFWIVVLYIIVKIVENTGLKRYEQLGG